MHFERTNTKVDTDRRAKRVVLNIVDNEKQSAA